LKASCIRRINHLAAAGRRRLRSGGKGLRLVTGSPAADADCLGSSIGYAFLQSLDAPAERLVAPWVPIPRMELALRPEVVLLARRAGLIERCLPCSEDFAPELLSAGGGREPALAAGPELVLVDSDGAWLPAEARRRIVEVLDHHPGARRPEEAPAARMTVEAVGSACTLVTERLLARDPALVDPGLALLLLGPILLDTVLFDSTAERTTPRDRQAAARLAAIARVGEAELYVELLDARQGLPGLDSRDLLRRDYKGGEAGGLRYGISSSPVSLRRWRERDATPEQAALSFREERGLDVLLVMIAYEEPGAGGFRRELGVAAGRHTDMVTAWLQTAGLRLRELPAVGQAQVRWFSQEAVEVSRKMLEPRLRAWMEGPRG
jgi:inorganic pyrophosphatase/exopolyphosphatase